MQVEAEVQTEYCNFIALQQLMFAPLVWQYCVYVFETNRVNVRLIERVLCLYHLTYKQPQVKLQYRGNNILLINSYCLHKSVTQGDILEPKFWNCKFTNIIYVGRTKVYIDDKSHQTNSQRVVLNWMTL